MNNTWTGGQYSLFRALFGSYLFIHFILLLPYAKETYSNAGNLSDSSLSPLIALFPNVLLLNDSPSFVILFIALCAVASLFFIMGHWDRIAALIIWIGLASLFGRNPLTSNPSLPYVGWMLVAHCFLPSAPYGSLRAKDRVDPAGEWKFPKWLFLAAWIVMSLSYTYSGLSKLQSPSWVDGKALFFILENPLARDTILRDAMVSLPPILLKVMTWTGLGLEILFAPLALLKKYRPCLWGAMCLLHIQNLFLIDFADLSFGMLFLHFFTFNPGWIPCPREKEKEIIFYDGDCGLCHHSVRWVLAEDLSGHFQFSPLQGELFEIKKRAKALSPVPDSIIIWNENRPWKIKSDAIIHIQKQCGGIWAIGGFLMGFIPRLFRDAFYDIIANIRKKIFKAPKDLCPILPEKHIKRFLN